MRWQRPMYADASARIQAMMDPEQAGEAGRPVGILPHDLPGIGLTGRHEERRGRRRRADAAEPPPERATQVEQPEMQACRRLDKSRLAAGQMHHAGSGTTGVERT
jgi:hypothetical protein